MARACCAASCRPGCAPACPSFADAVGVHITLELLFHHLGGQQQRQFAQLGELFRRQVTRSPPSASDLPAGRPRSPFRRPNAMKLCGHRIEARAPGDAFHRGLLFAICCRLIAPITLMPCRANLFHILPAMRMRGCRADCRCASSSIRQTCGRALQDGVHVHRSTSPMRSGGMTSKLADQLRDIVRALGLHHADHHVLAALRAPPPFVEHAQRLADARRVTQENLQTPAAGRAPPRPQSGAGVLRDRVGRTRAWTSALYFTLGRAYC